MEKGVLGIRLSFYAVLAFILAAFGSETLVLLFLLAGVVLLVEKNAWATRQIIQAICLCFVSSIVNAFFDIFDFMSYLPYVVYYGWNIFRDVVTSLVDIAVYVFVIIAIVRNAKGQEANVPLASKFANWAYGIVVVKAPTYVQQPVQQPYAQPMQQPYAQPVQQPVQPQAPVQPAQQAPVQPQAPQNPQA